jgi:tripartite ATP-independent transporter DctM subunit
MACLLESSGIAGDLYTTMHKWMGGLRGGLAMGTVIICALIDAMSGLGATATLTMGLIALPEMLKRGYSKYLAVGCIPPAGALGPLIPPSILMIILGGLAQQSVGKLFMAGVLPGLLIVALFVTYILVICFVRPEMGPALPKSQRGTWKEKLISLRGVILPIFLVVAIMGGIYSGACTPTEAGGIGAFGTFLILVFRKKLTWRTLTDSLSSTMRINAMVIWLLIGGSSFSSFLNSIGVASFLGNSLSSMPIPNIAVVLIMLGISVIMGCFIDGASVLMICSPIFYPVIHKMPEFDPIWFSTVFIMSLVVGYVTPPFGMNLFYIKGLAPENITMKNIWVATSPFTIIMIVGILICVFFPIICTFLPSLMR